MIVEPRVVNMTRYIPVEPETDGGIPILKSTGLKMAPPPRPRAPETQPPTKPKRTSRLTISGASLRSLLQMPRAYLILSFCSKLFLLIASKVTEKHTRA